MASEGGIGGGGGGQYIWVSPIAPPRVQSAQLIARLKKLCLSQPTTVRPRGLAYPRFNVLLNLRLKALNTRPPFKAKLPHNLQPKNLLWRLIPLIQPPAAKLGVRPRGQVFPRFNVLLNQRLKVLNTRPPVLKKPPQYGTPLTTLIHKLRPDIQPPAAKLGVRPEDIFRAREDLLRAQSQRNTSARPPWGRPRTKSLLDRVVRIVDVPVPPVVKRDQLPPLRVKRQQAVAAKRLPVISIRTKAIRAQAPSGFPLKLLKRKAAKVATPIRRGPPKTLVQRLARLSDSLVVFAIAPKQFRRKPPRPISRPPLKPARSPLKRLSVLGASSVPAVVSTASGGDKIWINPKFNRTKPKTLRQRIGQFAVPDVATQGAIWVGSRHLKPRKPIKLIFGKPKPALKPLDRAIRYALPTAAEQGAAYAAYRHFGPRKPIVIRQVPVKRGLPFLRNRKRLEAVVQPAIKLRIITYTFMPLSITPIVLTAARLGVPPKRFRRKGAIVKVQLAPRPKPINPVRRIRIGPQPLAAALGGTWAGWRKHKPKGAVVRVNLGRKAPALKSKWLIGKSILPPASALGVVPKRIFRRGAKVPFVLAARPAAIRTVRRLRRLIQPPVVQPVKPKQFLRKGAVVRVRIAPRPKAVRALWRRNVITRGAETLGFPPRRILRKGAVVRVRIAPRPSAIRPVKRLTHLAQPPLISAPPRRAYRHKGAVVRVVIAPRPKALNPVRRLRRYVQPPAAKLGVPPKRVLRKGARVRLVLGPRAKPIRPLKRLTRFPQPTVINPVTPKRLRKPRVRPPIIIRQPKPVMLARKVRLAGRPQPFSGATPRQLKRRPARQYSVIRQPLRRNVLSRLHGLLLPKPPPPPIRIQRNLDVFPQVWAQSLTIEVLQASASFQLVLEPMGAVQALTIEVLQASVASSLAPPAEAATPLVSTPPPLPPPPPPPPEPPTGEPASIDTITPDIDTKLK